MAFGRFEAPKEFVTLTPEQVFEYSAAAKQHYRADYPYHGWDHALDVISGTEIISTKLEHRGLVIAKGALVVAAAWHDTGYHEDHSVKGFSTKEEYSAHLLDEYLKNKAASEWEKTMMHNAIVATWADHKTLRTPYELIMHRSDIANIGGPTDEFLQNSLKLLQEQALITGRTPSWEEYVNGAVKFIEFTAAEHDHEALAHYIDPSDTTVDVHNVPFSEAARINIETLLDFDPTA